jgi:homocysteine S-methyltransferase
MHPLKQLLKNKETVVLDSAMGTEIQRLGYKTYLPLWTAPANEEAPDLVKKIHEDNIRAGADIITTNTFRTIRWTYSKIGQVDKAKELTKKAVGIAQNATKSTLSDILVAGSISTLEDCYEPMNVPSAEILEEEHQYQVDLLASLGVDFILVETINSIIEAKATSEAVTNAGIPFILSFVTDGNGSLLSGESINDAIKSIASYSPEAIMLNCAPLEVINQDFKILCNNYSGYKGLYANGCGYPHDELGWEFDDSYDASEKYVTYFTKWKNKGLKIIGGCCGTNSDYIKAISQVAKS